MNATEMNILVTTEGNKSNRGHSILPSGEKFLAVAIVQVYIKSKLALN